MKIIILGSGVIGATTAYFLAKNGHQVEVIERQDGPALECSYANGGQLSYSHAEPWASARILPKIPKWLMDKYSPLVFRPSIDFYMWSWIGKFLLCCNDKKSLKSTEHMLRLSLYSRNVLHSLTDEIDFDFSYSKKGILHIFKDEKSLQANIEHAKFQNRFGCQYEVLLNREECERKEPALKSSPKKIVGGIFFPMDESGNVNQFTVGITKKAQNLGVKFHFNESIEKFTYSKNTIKSIITNKKERTADKFVVALGAYSPILLRKIGINIPIYPMKGYSVSIKVENQQATPNIGFTDQGNKIVYSRLGDILRVAGTAEFAGYDHSIKPKRIKALKKMIKCLFPASGNLEAVTEWACLRPSTPDGLPVLGNTRYNNLILNTGHGTLGWTLSFGSASIIADLIDGKAPSIDLTGMTIERF